MRFNKKTKKAKKVIKNHEGAKAYKVSPKMELYTSVVTSSLSNKFYETGQERLTRIKKLMKQVDPDFIAKLALYTREKMYLRSIPLVLTVELSKIHNGTSLVKNTVGRVVKRADEITELLAYYQLANKRNGVKKLNRLSKQIQKGLSLAFNKFDEYQFAKYNRKREVTLKDALFLTHPKADDENQQALFNKIVNDTLEVPYTWEVELSKLGQQKFESEAAKKEAVRLKWSELIESGRLGYMALMRNLRNILQANVESTYIEKVGERLANPAQVRRSKQLPFRFLAAYRELELIKSPHASYLMSALEDAIKVSVENIKGFNLHTKVVLASDVSGSMYRPISPNSKIQCYDIGLTLSMLMRYKSDSVITGIFGSTWKTVNLPKANILSNTQKLRNIAGQVGYATNGHKVIEYLNQNRMAVDKVMMFTDVQLYNSQHGGNSLEKEWLAYKRNVAPNAKLYVFDLAGYGNTPLEIGKNDVYKIAGWSDKVFEVLEAIEQGSTAVKEIMEYA